MKSTIYSGKSRSAVRGLVASMAFVGVLAAGTSAMPVAVGQPTSTTSTGINAGMVSLIDGAKTATLTIHKLLGDPTGQPADGTPQTVAGTPYEATFTVARIAGLDPTNIADWEKFSKLDVNNPGTLEAAQTVTTTGGVATLSNLPLGFYKVVEQPSTQTNASRTTIAPFLTALPMTDQAAPGAWRYDVHVYPKNQELKLVKQVTDANKQVGEIVSYTITADIPAPPATGDISGFEITDRWEASEIAPDTATLQVSVGTASLISGTDYTVSPIESSAPDFPTKSQFKVTLTPAGLTKVSNERRGNPAAQVKLTVDAKITAVGGTEAVNEAVLTTPTASVLSTAVESKFGQIQLRKLNGSDKVTVLPGATFELYKCNPGTTDLVSDQKVTVNGQSSWVSGANGLVTIDGVQLEDFQNGAAVTDSFDYCVIETKAPDGYELNPKPISVPVNTKTSSTTGIYLTTADVLDYPINGGFRLPTTGAAGVAGLIAVGGLIAAVAVLLNRRKSSQAEKQLLGS